VVSAAEIPPTLISVFLAGAAIFSLKYLLILVGAAIFSLKYLLIYVTNLKVAGSRPVEVNDFYQAT
jgi:hypothetical protein